MATAAQTPPPNLLGLTTMAQKYRDTMVLFTAMDPVQCVVDGAPPGPMGRLFIVPTDKPVRVPFEAGRFILEHLGYTGVVRVQEVENDEGIRYLVDEAREESLVKGEEEDHKRMQAYVEYCVKDKMENKKPVPAPPESIMRIIDRRKFDLGKFGIVPLGWESPTEANSKALVDENKELRNRLKILEAKMADVLEANEAEEGVPDATEGSDAGDASTGRKRRPRR
jgi:hypothetical protein